VTLVRHQTTQLPRLVGLAAVLGIVAVALTTSPVLAAKGTHGGGGGGSSVPTGNDVSYPQCGGSLPTSPAFGIVGVNGGLANDLNPCLGISSSYPSYSQSELYWAVASSVGSATQPRASLYVNTADPGNVYKGNLIADWPKSGSSVTYGACTTITAGGSTMGQNSPACAYQYGYNKAAQDAQWLTSAADSINQQPAPSSVSASPATYPWWLDVETGNTWQSGTSGQAMNVADLQGMIAALQAAGVTAIGAYSTTSQWDQITGGTTSTSGSLYGLSDWIPGAKTLSAAEANCTLASFTSGAVELTQWAGRSIDSDYACP